MYPDTKQAFSKLNNFCVNPPTVKIKLNPELTFPAGLLSFSCARGFPTETNQFCLSILKEHQGMQFFQTNEITINS